MDDAVIADLELCEQLVRTYWWGGQPSSSGTYGLSALVIARLRTSIRRLSCDREGRPDGPTARPD